MKRNIRLFVMLVVLCCLLPGCKQGVSIYVSLRGLKELPTLGWIAQFGIKPLEGAY